MCFLESLLIRSMILKESFAPKIEDGKEKHENEEMNFLENNRELKKQNYLER